jgi:enoyl-CoA hydratase/carnithine racemase
MIDELLLSKNDSVATLTLNRPQQHNAITYAMWRALPTLCRQLDEDATVRVVIMRGAGEDAFSAGGDISEFAWQRANRNQAMDYNAHVDAALDAVAGLGKPSIALIKGHCIGGGLMLACACDLRIAAANARFAMPVGRLGNVITYPELKRFVDLIGPGATADLLLTGRTLDAAEAQAVGLCSQVHPGAEIESVVGELTQRMARFSSVSQREHKRMLQVLLRQPDLRRLTPAEIELQTLVFDSADYAEGARAFIEKRAPEFSGC